MKIVKQVRPFNGYDSFMVRVYRKDVFIRGWHAQVQIGQRAWGFFPGPRARERQMRQMKGAWEK